MDRSNITNDKICNTLFVAYSEKIYLDIFNRSVQIHDYG